jgi:SAM-dependent methyltransferase
MGIPRVVARLLLDEHRERPFSGSLLQLSRLSVYFTGEQLEGWAREQKVALAPGFEPRLSHDPALADLKCIDDRTFFGRLGFERTTTCDISNWEGADLLHDLNHPIPEAWKGQYDVVIESGTIQHVFHLPNVLRNLHDFIRPGGRIIHGMVASINHVDHGFYMFSPTLFNDYYARNGYRIDSLYFYEFMPYWYRGRFHTRRTRIFRYTPGCLDHLSYGGFSGQQLALFVAVTRTAAATSGAIPQQSYFERLWATASAAKAVAPRKPGPIEGARNAILAAAPPLEHAYLAMKYVRSRLARLLPRRMPPVVARY